MKVFDTGVGLGLRDDVWTIWAAGASGAYLDGVLRAVTARTALKLVFKKPAI